MKLAKITNELLISGAHFNQENYIHIPSNTSNYVYITYILFYLAIQFNWNIFIESGLQPWTSLITKSKISSLFHLSQSLYLISLIQQIHVGFKIVCEQDWQVHNFYHACWVSWVHRNGRQYLCNPMNIQINVTKFFKCELYS